MFHFNGANYKSDWNSYKILRVRRESRNVFIL